jgi:hypothetical protein
VGPLHTNRRNTFAAVGHAIFRKKKCFDFSDTRDQNFGSIKLKENYIRLHASKLNNGRREWFLNEITKNSRLQSNLGWETNSRFQFWEFQSWIARLVMGHEPRVTKIRILNWLVKHGRFRDPGRSKSLLSGATVQVNSKQAMGHFNDNPAEPIKLNLCSSSSSSRIFLRRWSNRLWGSGARDLLKLYWRLKWREREQSASLSLSSVFHNCTSIRNHCSSNINTVLAPCAWPLVYIWQFVF